MKLTLANGEVVSVHNIPAFAVAAFKEGSEEAVIVGEMTSYRESQGRLYELLMMVMGA